MNEFEPGLVVSSDIPAEQWQVIVELYSLLAQPRNHLPERMEQAGQLLIRLFAQFGSVGALIHWQSTDYVAGLTGPQFKQLRASLNIDPESDPTEQGSYIAIAVDGPLKAADDELSPQAAQMVLERAATTISLSLESRLLKAERDRALDRNAVLERLVAQSPVIAFIWRPTEGWPVQYVSENVQRLGYQPEDFLSGNVKYEDIIFPEDRERVAAEVKSNLDAGNACYEQVYRILTLAGKKRLVHDRTMVTRDSADKVVSIEGIIEDITELAEADERARQRLELTNNLFVLVDNNGQVLDANTRTCDLLGVDREELLGSNWIERFVPEDSRSEVFDYLGSQLQGSRSGVEEFENDILTGSGERRRIHWYNSLEVDENGHTVGAAAFGADVTAVRNAELSAQMQAALLMGNPNPVCSISAEGDVVVANDAAQGLLNDIATCECGPGGWKRLVDLALEPDGAPTCELFVAERTYVFMISRSGVEGNTNLYGIDVTEQKALSAQLENVAQNMPGAIFEYTLYPDGTDAIHYMNEGCEKIWETPASKLKRDPAALWEMVEPTDLPDMVRSVQESARQLTNWSYEWRIMTPSGKFKWLRGAATPVSTTDGGARFTTIVIDVTSAKNAHEAVSAALRKTIYVLSAALEARDPYTAGHEQRVTEIAVKIGREMGLSAHRLMGLELAAMVHDVGKIQIPSEILSKPGRLSKVEFELIKGHSAVGADLLRDIDFEWPISDMVRQHHERMDGSGYPDGLSGDEILLEARIIGVADVLEAMASHRPYRAGLGIEKAAEEIRAGAGTRYDKRVAETCLQLVAEGTIHIDSSVGFN